METRWDEVAPEILNVEDMPEISKRLKSQYFKVKEEESSQRLDLIQNFDNYVNIIHDSSMNYPLQVSAKLHSQFAPVYLYYVNYTSEFSFVSFTYGVQGKWWYTIEVIIAVVTNLIHRKIFGTYPPFHGKIGFENYFHI